MTVQDLQNTFGFPTPQAICKRQRGTAMPTLDNLVVLAAVFGTTLDAIIVRTNASTGQISVWLNPRNLSSAERTSDDRRRREFHQK